MTSRKGRYRPAKSTSGPTRAVVGQLGDADNPTEWLVGPPLAPLIDVPLIEALLDTRDD